MKTAEEQVIESANRGAEFLDKTLPEGWFQGINLDRLQMDSCVDCILGQLYGSYSMGIEVLKLDYVSDELHEYLPEYLGFVAGFGDQFLWVLLRNEWKKLITERKESVPA